MEPLDKPMGNIDPNSVSPQPIALRYGLIWGLIGIMLGLIAHVMGWNNPANSSPVMGMLIGLISMGISCVMIFLAVKQHRDQDLGGYMVFGRGFKTGFLTTVVNALIATVWMVIFVTFISPDFFEMMEAGIISQWEAQGMTDDQIEQAMPYASMFSGPIITPVFTFIGTLVIGSIISLIVSAILKKEAPMQQY